MPSCRRTFEGLFISGNAHRFLAGAATPNTAILAVRPPLLRLRIVRVSFLL